MDYKFPNDEIRRKALADKLFVPSNIIPIDIDVDYRGEFMSFYKLIIFNWIILFSPF